MPNVLLIITQDTKEEECRFIRTALEDGGCDVVLLDPSVRRTVGGAEISPEEVAAAAGMTLEEIRAIGHEGKIQGKMIEGAIKVALAAQGKYDFAGILSIGGSMGTTLGTFVMQQFPFGMPKLMISTIASGFVADFVGVKDIMMMNSVCDISGLNTISREVFLNGAHAMAGMALKYEPIKESNKPLVLVSTLGTTELCSRRVREGLEAEGCEVMVFHTTGNGGKTLEAIAGERDITAIVDMSLVETNDVIHDGLCAVPGRGEAGLNRHIPTIFAPGNIDFFIKPTEMANEDSPFEGRNYHIHNPALTAVRTNEADLQLFADHMAGLCRNSSDPIKFYVPLRGFSNHDSPDGHLQEPTLPPIFAAQLKKAMPENVEVIPIDAHINDAPFADAMIASVSEILAKK